MYRENPEETDDRQYYDYHLDRNGSPLESELKQQTAVNWLNKELEDYGDSEICEIGWKQLDLLIQQAKEIEKERMKDAWDDGLFGKTDNFQQYYNETFGK